MKAFSRRVSEMLERVLVFAGTYPHYFEAGSIAAELIEEIGSAVGKLSINAQMQTSGKTDVLVSSGERAVARAALRRQLEVISRTARGLKLKNFWLPRDRSDGTLIEVGRMFAERAEAVKPLFVQGGLPADFIAALVAATGDLQNTIKHQTHSTGRRVSATAAIEHAQNDALSALMRLDPIIENLLRNDAPTLAVWESARHVERLASAKPLKKDASSSAPPAPPPAESTSSAPAQP